MAEKIKDDFLTCSICYEVFHQPVSLFCQHSFCRNCLNQYLQTLTQAATTKTIPCPTCRQGTPVPHPDRPLDEWTGQLKPGLLLTGLMDSLQETTKCSVCSGQGKTTPATHWCSECEAGFCDHCLEMHRRMPILRQHAVTNLKEDNTVPKVKKTKTLLCKTHEEKIKLYCKDCKVVMCAICCSLFHKNCDNVVTTKDVLPEVKGQLMKRQQELELKHEEAELELDGYNKELERVVGTKETISSEIEQILVQVEKYIEKKKAQLLEKLEDHTTKRSGELSSKVNAKKVELQEYQHQCQVIQQALELEDEAHLFEMYLSSGSGAAEGAVGGAPETENAIRRSSRSDVMSGVAGIRRLSRSGDVTEIYNRGKGDEDGSGKSKEKTTGAEEQETHSTIQRTLWSDVLSGVAGIRRLSRSDDVTEVYNRGRTDGVRSGDVTEKNKTCGADIKFEHDLHKLMGAIDEMDIRMDVIDLTATPVFQGIMAGTLTPTDKCKLTGVAILKINDTNVTVVTDYNKNRVKSFYPTDKVHKCSSLTLCNSPVSIAVLDKDKVVISVPGPRRIVTVTVSPDLKLHSEITTFKQYMGLDVLDQMTLVASSDSPPSVDVLNLQGQVIRSLPNPHKVFSGSFVTHVTTKGAILLSDLSLKSIICLSQTWQVLWVYTPTGDRAMRTPSGITSTSTGDILVTDKDAHKVVHLSESGEFIRDVLTTDHGLEHPIGLFVDGDKLYVVNVHKGVLRYRFIQAPSK